MYYTYVLKSLTHGTLYVGSSTKPEVRLEKEHNNGKVRYTKGRKPWVLLYKEAFEKRSEAVRRERFFKTGKGRQELSKILGKVPGSSNGRTPGFGPGNLGSNPSPGTLPGRKNV